NFGQGPFSGSEEELLDTCDSKWWRSVLSIVEVDKVLFSGLDVSFTTFAAISIKSWDAVFFYDPSGTEPSRGN
ncbi:hypothetical protein, partial [Acinetobacter baumannii]|uniref:hypothetical protein n=1 Tax=Acinetobacter baumannii TaxID=470 RepID=UPI001D0E7325